MFQVLINSSPIFVAIFLGYLSKAKGWIPPESKKVVSFLSFKLIVPFLVFKTFTGVKFGSDNIGVLYGTLVLITGLIVGSYLLGKYLKNGRQKMGVIMSALPTLALGPFVYPLVMANFDNIVFQQVVLIDITQFLSILIVSYAFALHYGNGGKISYKNLLKKLITNPVIVSIAIIMVLNYMGISMSKEAMTFFDFFSRSFGFLAAFFVGLLLDFSHIKNSQNIILIVVARSLMAEIVVYLLLLCKIIPNNFAIPFYLCALAPIATLPSIYATEAGLDESYVSILTVTSYFLALILFPVALMVLV